jgi:hypothetical protein
MAVGVLDDGPEVGLFAVRGRGQIRAAEKDDSVGEVEDPAELVGGGVAAIERGDVQIGRDGVEMDIGEVVVPDELDGLVVVGRPFLGVVDADDLQVFDRNEALGFKGGQRL